MKKLFVIMPFGLKTDYVSGQTINFDNIYKNLIKPIEKLEDWSVYRIDEFSNTGLITNQYLKELLEADIVLAEITTPNANVFYELGIRQTISSRGTILIAQEGTDLPFDISTQRVIFYSNSIQGFKDAESEIIKSLKNYNLQTSPINDFFRYYRKGIMDDQDYIELEREFKHQLSISNTLGEIILIWDWVKEKKLFPEHHLYMLSEKFINKQQWNLAEEVLKKSFKQNPKDLLVLKELGWVISKRGEDYYNEALNYLNSALDLDSKNSEVLGIIGGIYKSQGDLDKAITYYSLGSQYSPNSNYMLIVEAALTIMNSPDQPQSGITKYQKVKENIFIDENYESDIWALVNLAEVNFVTSNVKDSIILFEKIIKEFEDIKPIISACKQIDELGRYGFKTKESKEVLHFVNQTLEQNGKDLEVAHNISNSEISLHYSIPLIIHISDLHFGSKVSGESMHRFNPTEDDRRTLENHLVEEIKSKYSSRISNLILIASGDFVYMGNEMEFISAVNCLNKICEDLSISKERVVIVPGNHDINWVKDKGGPGKRFEDYLVFLHKFYGESLLFKLYPFLNEEDFKITGLPVKPENIISFHNVNDLITIVGMNSCIYEDSQQHYGYMGWQQFKNIKGKLEEESYSNKVKLAVIHHQLHPFPEPISNSKNGEKWIDLSIIRDGGYAERKLQELGFDVVFHGHKHRPQIRETKVSTRSRGYEKMNSLIVLGAGSIGVDQTERGQIPNHFQTIEFLSYPRVKSIDFLKVKWHELEDEIGADWQSDASWIING